MIEDTQSYQRAFELIESLDNHDYWEIDDYEFEIGMWDGPELSITLVPTVPDDEQPDTEQQDDSVDLKEIIWVREDEHEDGASKETVIEDAMAAGLSEEEVERRLDNLKQKGQIYEPRSDRLRVT